MPMPEPTEIAPADPPDRATLDAELARLNDELRVLRSTDFTARAWAETWLAAVAWCVVGKLLFDWYRSLARWPWLVVPVSLAGIALTLDVVRVRGLRRPLVEREEAGLRRQRELRRLLGIDEARLPAAESRGAGRAEPLAASAVEPLVVSAVEPPARPAA